jgi:GntR family transcriptional regulator
VARELGIDRGASVVVRHQRRFVDNNPSSLQTSFYPMDFLQRGAVRLLEAADIMPGVTGYLKAKLGIEQGGYRDRLTVRAPNSGEISFFRIPDDGTVLIVVTHRTAYDLNVKPMRYTVTAYPADRNHFVIDFGNVPSLGELINNL